MLSITPDQVNELIRKRRSIFPPMYNQRPVEEEIIRQLLENANWAPTHRKTEPWRFKVVTGSALERLGNFLADHYQQHTPADDFSPMKHKKKLKKVLQSSAIILICMQRDPQERVPEWEELAATACAVQNLWLTATAYGIGGYWSSPAAIHQMNEFTELAEGEQCLGLFYLGRYDAVDIKGERGPIAEKVNWISE